MGKKQKALKKKVKINPKGVLGAVRKRRKAQEAQLKKLFKK